MPHSMTLTTTPVSGNVPNRICIVMLTAVGDAVHVLPVINALKQANPHTHITWILQPGPATLVRGHQHVDEIILFGPLAWCARVHGYLPGIITPSI